MKLARPPKWNGEPFDLFHLDTLSTYEGILEEQDILSLGLALGERVHGNSTLEKAVHSVVGTIFTHFTQKEFGEYFALGLYDPNFKLNGEQLGGLNYGPYCLVAGTTPASTISAAFHEVGHGMYCAKNPFLMELGAYYIEKIFTRKLHTEFFGMGVVKVKRPPLTGVHGEAREYAKELVESDQRPTDLTNDYNAKWMEGDVFYQKILQPGYVLKLKTRKVPTSSTSPSLPYQK